FTPAQARPRPQPMGPLGRAARKRWRVLPQPPWHASEPPPPETPHGYRGFWPPGTSPSLHWQTGDTAPRVARAARSQGFPAAGELFPLTALRAPEMHEAPIGSAPI